MRGLETTEKETVDEKPLKVNETQTAVSGETAAPH